MTFLILDLLRVGCASKPRDCAMTRCTGPGSLDTNLPYLTKRSGPFRTLRTAERTERHEPAVNRAFHSPVQPRSRTGWHWSPVRSRCLLGLEPGCVDLPRGPVPVALDQPLVVVALDELRDRLPELVDVAVELGPDALLLESA